MSRAIDLIWTDIELTKEGVSRSDPTTWTKWFYGIAGIHAELAQTAGSWHVRGISNLKSVFAAVWKTDDLIVSMDAVLIWRPWSRTATGKGTGDGDKGADGAGDAPWRRPQTEGLHLDQNPFSKPHRDCVQGMMPLLDVTPQTGGLEVVPGTHTDKAKQEFCARYAELQGRGDWCTLNRGDPLEQHATLLLAEAGDLVLWDSRTVHGGRVGEGQDRPWNQLARMSVTVAMTPRRLANEAVLERRRRGFEAGESFNHCPHEAGTSSGTIHARRKRQCQKFTLTEAQRALL